jgi:hypothetical protein
MRTCVCRYWRLAVSCLVSVGLFGAVGVSAATASGSARGHGRVRRMVSVRVDQAVLSSGRGGFAVSRASRVASGASQF